MNLYGQDMDQSVSPLEANMGWTVAWAPEDRAFLGRSALAAQKAEGAPTRQVGCAWRARACFGPALEVFQEGPDGAWPSWAPLTSGAFSPTLKEGIGLAHQSDRAQGGKPRGELRAASTGEPCRCRPPFIKKRS